MTMIEELKKRTILKSIELNKKVLAANTIYRIFLFVVWVLSGLQYVFTTEESFFAGLTTIIAFIGWLVGSIVGGNSKKKLKDLEMYIKQYFYPDSDQ